MSLKNEAHQRIERRTGVNGGETFDVDLPPLPLTSLQITVDGTFQGGSGGSVKNQAALYTLDDLKVDLNGNVQDVNGFQLGSLIPWEFGRDIGDLKTDPSDATSADQDIQMSWMVSLPDYGGDVVPVQAVKGTKKLELQLGEVSDFIDSPTGSPSVSYDVTVYAFYRELSERVNRAKAAPPRVLKGEFESQVGSGDNENFLDIRNIRRLKALHVLLRDDTGSGNQTADTVTRLTELSLDASGRDVVEAIDDVGADAFRKFRGEAPTVADWHVPLVATDVIKSPKNDGQNTHYIDGDGVQVIESLSSSNTTDPVLDFVSQGYMPMSEAIGRVYDPSFFPGGGTGGGGGGGGGDDGTPDIIGVLPPGQL